MTYHYQFQSNPALVFHIYLEASNLKNNYVRNEGNKLYIVVVVK